MRVNRQLLLVCLAVVFAMLCAACVSDAESDPATEDGAVTDDATEDGSVARTTIVPTMRPTSADDLGIALDRFGRPYDNYWGPEGAIAEMRLLTRLQVPGGRIELVEGEAFQRANPVTVSDTTTIDFRESGEFDLRIVWERRQVDEPDADSESESDSDSDSDSDSAHEESILGVFVGLQDRTVARWGSFANAYESSNGLGGITTRSVLDWADRNAEPGEPLIDGEFIDGRPFILGDLDTEPGRDIMLFDHGVGRGTRDFVYTRGFDEDDRLVAIMVWDQRFPWRLAVSEGTPPPDVTEREDELLDCIEGRRLIDKWGRCT